MKKKYNSSMSYFIMIMLYPYTEYSPQSSKRGLNVCGSKVSVGTDSRKELRAVQARLKAYEQETAN